MAHVDSGLPNKCKERAPKADRRFTPNIMASGANLLSIPFKKTYELDIKAAARKYFLNHGDTHPDALKTDINQWQELRQDGVGGVAHVDRINAALM